MRSVKRIIYNWIDRQFLSGCSSYNSLEVRKSCRTKLQARIIFAKNGVPYAKGTTFFWPFKAVRFAKKYGFPLVIKPNVSGFSRGSYFPITSYRGLLKAIVLAKIWWPVTVVEQYLEGKNYRVLVVKGEIMSVIRRYPPFVDGDGHLTIEELIDQENDIRKEMKLYPVIHPIPKDRKINGYLRRQNLTLESLPAAGERIRLYNRISLAPGGVVEIIDRKTLPAENNQLFTELLAQFGANILGIDAIFERGIEESYRNQKVILLEVNSRPYLKMHDYPRYGITEDLSRFYTELDKMEVVQRDIF